jgi:hypothetical protein
VRHIIVLIALVVLCVLGYKLCVGGTLDWPGTGAAAGVPAVASARAPQQPAQPQKPAASPAQAPQSEKPEDIVDGILSAGKGIGKGASRTFERAGSAGQ